jgi:GGDEF domain-containing protein
MPNYANQIRFSLLILIALAFSAGYFYLYYFQFDMQYFLYILLALMVSMIGLLLGSILGIFASLIAIFIFIGSFLYNILTSSGFFDFQFNQGLWLFIYLVEGIFFGMIGDGIIFYYKLQKQHPTELNALARERKVKMVTDKQFEELIGEAIARANRRKSHFTILNIALEDYAEVTRAFNGKALFLTGEKIIKTIMDIVEDGDTLTHKGDTHFEVLCEGQADADVKSKAQLIMHQLLNSYFTYGKTNIKCAIGVRVGLATYPHDAKKAATVRAQALKQQLVIKKS